MTNLHPDPSTWRLRRGKRHRAPERAAEAAARAWSETDLPQALYLGAVLAVALVTATLPLAALLR
jgi:hypothetical protein